MEACVLRFIITVTLLVKSSSSNLINGPNRAAAQLRYLDGSEAASFSAHTEPSSADASAHRHSNFDSQRDFTRLLVDTAGQDASTDGGESAGGEITVAIHGYSPVPESKRAILRAALTSKSLRPLFLGAEGVDGAFQVGRAGGGAKQQATTLQNNLAACSAVTPCPSFSPCSEDSPLSGIHACDSPHSLHDSNQSLADRWHQRNATCPAGEDEMRMTRVLPSHCTASAALLKKVPHAWSQRGFASYPETEMGGVRGVAAQAGVRDWAGRVFRLEDVFVDWRGRVFNSTHRFFAGGCSSPDLRAGDGDGKEEEDDMNDDVRGT